MYGVITGITDTDEISFCPKCGERIKKIMLMGQQHVRIVIIGLELLK